VSVGDCDTIRVRGRNGETVTVRLACIDAPEAAQGSVGADAIAALKQLLTAGRLELRPQTVDRYERTVAEVPGVNYVGGRLSNRRRTQR
jgi:endonuclease YncB( thermonuclease family)